MALAPGLPGTEIPYSVSMPITRRTVMPATLRGGARLGPVTDQDPPEEQVAIVDDDGGVVGSAPRSVMRRDNLPHLVVAVLVRDPAGRVYVHRRTDSKDVFPGMHDCFAAGCMQAGEDPPGAAAREVAEELGVTGVPLERRVRGLVRRREHPPRLPRVHRDVRRDDHPPGRRGRVGRLDDAGRAAAPPGRPGWPFVPDGRQLVETLLADGRL